METTKSFFHYSLNSRNIGFEFGNGFVVEFFVPRDSTYGSYKGTNRCDRLEVKVFYKTHCVTNCFFECEKYDRPSITIEEVPMFLELVEKLPNSELQLMRLLKLKREDLI